MKKNKKSLLILPLLALIFLVPKAYADEETYSSKMSADKNSLEINDVVAITLDLSTTTDTTCTIGLSYDTSKLELENATGVASYSPSGTPSITVNNSANSSSKLKFKALAGGSSEIKVGTVTCNNTEVKGTPSSVNVNIKSPDLAGINISNGTISPQFNSNTTNYTAVLTAETTTISATAASQDSKITGNGDYSLKIGEKKEVKIVVSTPGGNKKTYTINLTRPADANKSNNTNLQYISFNGKKIEFDKDNLVYALTVKNTVENADIKFKVEDEKSKAELEGPEKLKEGENKYKITVTAEDGSTKEYTLIITRQKEKNTVEYTEEAILSELDNGKEQEIYVSVTQKEKIKTLDKTILKKLKETGKNITYEVTGDNKELLYSITLRGKNIKDTTKLFNFNMTFKSNYKSLIDKLTNNKKVIYLNFENKTDLPGKITVKVFVGNKFKNNEILYLYYYNDKENKLEKQARNLKVKSSYVEFDLEHTSEYILSDTDFDAKEPIRNDKNVYKAVISVVAGLLAMIIFIVVVIIVKKKKNNNGEKPKKEKKNKKKKTEQNEPLEETNMMEDNVDLEKTIQIDVPTPQNEQVVTTDEQTTSIENETSENITEQKQNEDLPNNTNNEESKTDNTDIEILDLDETNNKDNM